MKKQLRILCCLLAMVFLFAGCNKSNKKVVPSGDRSQIKNNVQILSLLIVGELDETGVNFVNPNDFSPVINGIQELPTFERKEWNQLSEILSAQLDMDFKSQAVYDSALNSYVKALPDAGNPKKIKYDTLEIDFGKEGGYEVTVNYECEKKDMELAISYNTEMQITNVAFNVQYSIGENLKKAGLNTLLGMGTVFCILILISLIISLFGIFPKIEAAKKAKAEAAKKAEAAVTAPAAPVAPVAEEEDLSDDLELAAVIAAAIAAYEGSEDASGYVVRSIRRSKKWQNA